jgi:hypothetical protein
LSTHLTYTNTCPIANSLSLCSVHGIKMFSKMRLLGLYQPLKKNNNNYAFKNVFLPFKVGYAKELKKSYSKTHV